MGPLNFNMTLNNVMNHKAILIRGVLHEELRPSKYEANSHKILTSFKNTRSPDMAPRKQIG